MQYDNEVDLYLPVSSKHTFYNVLIWHWDDHGDIIVWTNEDTEAWLEQHQDELAELVHDMLADDPNC